MVSITVGSWLTDYSLKGCTKIEKQACMCVHVLPLSLSVSKTLLTLESSLQTHSKGVSCASSRSLKTHLLMMFSVSMFHLNSSQMNVMLAN